MVFQTKRITTDVRIALDQNGISDALLETGDIDTLTMDELIRSKIEECSEEVLMAAPMHRLDNGRTFGDSLHWNSDFSGWTYLPEDFMRLVCFKMNDWERTVYKALDLMGGAYAQQQSRIAGIKGTPEKPKCAIVPRSEGRALEFFCSKSESAKVERAIYIPYPELTEYVLADGKIFLKKDADKYAGAQNITYYEGIDVCERCYRAIVNNIAASVSLSCENQAMYQHFSQRAQSLLS